jgi:pimeloyl-ACP methyl ester carboxylesterase
VPDAQGGPNVTVTEDISVAPDAREVARTEVLDVLDRYGHYQSLNTRCIVFVHGLTGDKVTTWRAKDAAKSFMQLVVTDDELTDYDVYSFGYRSRWFRGGPIENAARQLAVTINRIVKKGSRSGSSNIDSIALVAHSLGGLVCMQYIIDELQAGAVPPISGLLLYGVPSTGSQMLAYAKLAGFGIGIKLPIIREIMNLFLHGQRQIASLATGSEFLLNLHDQWAFRVVNGGDERAGPGRMWLPVRVATGEDDVVVTESSAKGFYGAIDWLPIPCGHIDLVKPTERNDLRFLHAKDFFQICRQSKGREVLTPLWNASQGIWRLRATPLIEHLEFRTFFGRPAQGFEPKKLVAECDTTCSYDLILENLDLLIGISLGEQARSDVWRQSPTPIYVHQIGLSQLPEQERPQLRSLIERVLASGTEEQVWISLFPELSVRINDNELQPQEIKFDIPNPRRQSTWIVRKYSVADGQRHLLGRKVRVSIQYKSFTPYMLGYFVFSSPWITKSANVRMVVFGEFEYFFSNYHISPEGHAVLREDRDSGDRREVMFDYPGVLIPGSFVELRWQRK